MARNTRKRNGADEMFEVTPEEIKKRNKDKIKSILNRDVKVVAKNESQKELIRSIKNNEITICTGKAGTGKTYVSLAFALSLLRAEGNFYQKLYLVKSVTTLKGEEMGFLKGDLQEKIEPFMWSFLINMEKMIEDQSIRNLIETDFIRPFPLAYARGASLDNCIIIADEIQNISLDNARTLLTRIGENSKMILLGDSGQIDLKNKEESSLQQLLNMFEDINEIGTIRMNEADTNIRNPLIDIIEKKYEEYNDKKENLTVNGRRKKRAA